MLIPVGIAGVPLLLRASGVSGSFPGMSVDAMTQLGATISLPDQTVVFISLRGYLEDGTPSGLQVSAPMYRSKEVGGHIAVRIDEFLRFMTPAHSFPVDILPGNEILSNQLERDPLLKWDREGIRRMFNHQKSSPSPKEVCLVSVFGPFGRPSRDANSWRRMKPFTRCHVCGTPGHWRGAPECLGAPVCFPIPCPTFHNGSTSSSASSLSGSSASSIPRSTLLAWQVPS